MLTEQQLINRKKGIGGSDAAKVCGVIPSPLQVYNEKLGLSDFNADNVHMYWGKKLEDDVLEAYTEKTGLLVTKRDQITSEKYPWMMANIDGWIPEKNAVIECKTANVYTKDQWGEEGTDRFPVQYLLQCAHYAIVTDCEYVDLAVLIGGSDFRIYRYKRLKKLEDAVIEKEKIFWHENILKKVMPDPMTSEEVQSLYKVINTDDFVYAEPPIVDMIKKADALNMSIKKLEEEKNKIEESLKLGLGEHAGYIDSTGNKLVTWLPQSRSSIDITKLKNTSPDIYKQFLRSSTSRVFRISKGALA